VKASQPVNVYDLMSWYTSDVMSELAFGKSFNNILRESFDSSVHNARAFMAFFGVVTPVPWVVRLGNDLLNRLNGWKNFIDFCQQMMSERIMVRVHNKKINNEAC
jgi:hypothetical protein